MNTKELMDTLVQSFEKEGNVRVCFGDPIEKDQITLIPVAKVITKGGAGSGNAKNPQLKEGGHSEQPKKDFSPTNTEEEDAESSPSPDPAQQKTTMKGTGVGLDIRVTPLGYIEIKNGEAGYKPIKDHDRIAIAGILYAAFTVFLAARTISMIARILAKKNIKRS